MITCSPARLALFVAVIILPLAVAGPVAGQTSWTGAVNSNWENSGNWSNGVPTQTVDAVFSAVSNQMIALSATQQVRALTFNDAPPGYSIGGTSFLTAHDRLTQNGNSMVNISANLQLNSISYQGFIGGVIEGPGEGSLVVSGSLSHGANGLLVNLTAPGGNLVIQGNTDNGLNQMSVLAGSVSVGKLNGALAASAVSLASGTTLNYLANEQVNSISLGGGSGIVNLNGFNETLTGITSGVTSTGQVRLGAGTLTIANTAVSSLGAELSGEGGRLVLASLGSSVGLTMTRPAGHSYTGGTTVNNGVLRVTNTSGSGTGTGPVQVNSGGRLDGSGSVAGTVALASGASIGGGEGLLDTISHNNPRTLAVGNLSLSSGSLTFASLRGVNPGDTNLSYSQINVGGNANLNGSLSVGVGTGFNPTGGTFYILSRASGSGEFVNLGEGAPILFAGGAYSGTITYLANWTGSQATSTLTGGNDIAIFNVVPVPEPTHILLLGASTAMGVRWYRRRIVSVRPSTGRAVR